VAIADHLSDIDFNSDPYANRAEAQGAATLDDLRRQTNRRSHLSSLWAWHRRVMANDVVAQAFSHSFHTQHVERSAASWAEALGGRTYSDSYGARPPWLRCTTGMESTMKWIAARLPGFDQALAVVGLANAGTFRQVLHDYFAWPTTTAMSSYDQCADDVPNGLSIPR